MKKAVTSARGFIQVTSTNPHDPDRLHELLDAAQTLREHVVIMGYRTPHVVQDDSPSLTDSYAWKALMALVKNHPCNQPHSDLMGQDPLHDHGQIDRSKNIA